MSADLRSSPPSGAARLADWGVIRASGDDARTFLHAQLTQDVSGLAPESARLAGFCSAKGRLQASFVLWRDGPADVLMACSADLLPAVLRRLSMFVLRAKCRLADASAEVALWGLAGGSVAHALGDAAQAPLWGARAALSGRVIRLPDAWVDGQVHPRWLLAAAGDAPPPALPALEAQAWRWLEVHSAVPRIVAATVDQFVPQMVNLELVGGVNFQKGCYPGQEVVARSQYRGTLKRRSALFACEQGLDSGDEVFHSADPGQPAGTVVLGASWSGRNVALVEVKIAAMQGGSLHARVPSGPRLTPLPMPYEIPAEAA